MQYGLDVVESAEKLLHLYTLLQIDQASAYVYDVCVNVIASWMGCCSHCHCFCVDDADDDVDDGDDYDQDYDAVDHSASLRPYPYHHHHHHHLYSHYDRPQSHHCHQ